jgi:hypothetical protein
MNFFNQLDRIEIEGISFWIGFIAATLFWWLFRKLIPYIKKAFVKLKESIQSARESMQSGADQKLRENTLKYVQNLHLISPLFSLDEILIVPKIMAPPAMIFPNQEPPLDYVTEYVIPYMPDFPELSAAYNGHTIPLQEALKGGANLIITGNIGSGKTTALAYLASLFSRRDLSLGELRNYFPIYIHANELTFPQEMVQSELSPIIDILTTRPLTVRESQLQDVINKAVESGRVVLLLDGLDEISANALKDITEYLDGLLDKYPDIRIVTATDTSHVDGLVALGFMSIPLAAWNLRIQAEYIKKWNSLWHYFIQPRNSEEINAIDPILLNGWLLADNAALTPLEFALKVWSAYAGDARGSLGMDAIEAYLRRMTVGIPKVRSTIDHLATQMILANRSTFTQGEAQSWTSGFDSDTLEGAGLSMVSDDAEEKTATRAVGVPRIISDLIRNGLLVSFPNNQLGFVHPIIACYLAGISLAISNEEKAIFSKPDWPMRRATIQFVASQSDLSDQAVKLITATGDPLHQGVIQAGSWLRFIPSDADWRKPILQNLANMLQQESLPLSFRSRILVCLVSTYDRGVASILRHLLNSNHYNVSQLAALGCGFLRDPLAVSELVKYVFNPTTLGQAACLALVNIGTKSAIDEAASIMLHGDESLRRAVAEAFAHNPEDGHPILQEGSSMDDLLIRRVSVYGLRLVKESWALQILEKMQIEDGQWVVRNAAAQVVEEINQIDPYIPQPLGPLEDIPWLIDFASERGMGISAGKPAVEMLVSVLKDGSRDQIYAALDLLWRLGEDEIFPEIYHLLYGENQEIAEKSYNTLWHLAVTGADLPPPIKYGLGY